MQFYLEKSTLLRTEMLTSHIKGFSTELIRLIMVVCGTLVHSSAKLMDSQEVKKRCHVCGSGTSHLCSLGEMSAECAYWADDWYDNGPWDLVMIFPYASKRPSIKCFCVPCL